MPSRPAVLGILAFWLATAGVVFDRDIRPRLFADAPPPLLIDLADEATQQAPTFWTVTRNGRKVGRVSTRMKYEAETDGFRFTSTYSDLKIDFDAGKLLQLAVQVPSLETTTVVGRAGDLRAQAVKAKLAAKLGGVKVADATADVTGTVTAGQLVGRCKIVSPMGELDQPLDPTPVPGGQVLNPLLPVNRLQDVRPGRRWLIREVDPLRDAIETLVRQVAKQSDLAAGLLPPRGERRELFAEVRADPEDVPRPDKTTVSCWVIEYRGGGRGGPHLGEPGRRPGAPAGGGRVRRATPLRAGGLT